MPLPSSPQPSSAAPNSRTLNVLLLGLCALLVALSYYSFTLYCESFGCIGVGLMWMLWAVAAAVAWAAGPVGWHPPLCW